MKKQKAQNEEVVAALAQAQKEGLSGKDATEKARAITGFQGRMMPGWHKAARSISGVKAPKVKGKKAKRREVPPMEITGNTITSATESRGILSKGWKEYQYACGAPVPLIEVSIISRGVEVNFSGTTMVELTQSFQRFISVFFS